MTKKRYSVLTVLGIMILVLAILLSTRFYFRLDLSANKVNTLAEVSRNLHRAISGVMRITYYVSDRLAAGHPIPDEIMGLLREYAAHSQERIEVQKKDPVKAGLKDAVEELGIMPQTVRLLENSEVITLEVYTGIVIEYLNHYEALPLVFSLETLEYDITTKILSIAQGREKEAGVIVASASKNWNDDYAILDSALRRAGFRIRSIAEGDEIPDALAMLFVCGGSDALDQWALYRIDRYIQNGGNVLFMLDSLAVDLAAGLAVMPVPDKGLAAMLASYGAAVLPAMVLDRSSLSIRYQDQNAELQTISYPQWLSITEQNLNRAHPITGNLKGLYLYWASPLELAPPQGVSAEPLVVSTSAAWLQMNNFNANPADPSLLEAEEARTKGVKTLGAVLSGIFPRFFNNEKPQREGSSEELPDMPDTASPARVVVIGDEDFAGAMMEIGGGEALNTEFLVRAADWLCHDEEAIGLRRTAGSGLDRITELSARKAFMNFSRNCNVFAIPAFVLLTGVIVLWRRRKKVLAAGVPRDL